jgi:hypothetical protein
MTEEQLAALPVPELVRRLIAETARADAAEAAPAARVRALVWGDCTTIYRDSRAREIGRKIAFGVGPILPGYTIYESLADGIHVVGGGGFGMHNLQSIETAKAAAQADYEARIRAALDVTPASPTYTADDMRAAVVRTVKDFAIVLCQDEIDRGDRNASPLFAAGARACRDAIRALANDPATVAAIAEPRR